MNPREELLHDFDKLVDSYHASRQETRAMLNQYAIGRWVSVDERLPELDEDGRWTGVMLTEGRVAAGIFDWSLCQSVISHWLELQLPEVEQ